jgi:hypothetical protein
MAGRRKAELVLTGAESEQLKAWALRRKTAQALALRSRIVLACAEGALNNDVAVKLRVTKQTVSKWRGRFVRMRLDGLPDAPRPGAPRTIEDARISAIIAKTLVYIVVPDMPPLQAVKDSDAMLRTMQLKAGKCFAMAERQRCFPFDQQAESLRTPTGSQPPNARSSSR